MRNSKADASALIPYKTWHIHAATQLPLCEPFGLRVAIARTGTNENMIRMGADYLL